MNDSVRQMDGETVSHLYTADMKVRWGDMDAMGHVNNTVYFRYCEQARMEWFATLDLSQSDLPDSQIVIINAWCEFVVPVVYPAQLSLVMYGAQPGNSSFMSYYSIQDSDSKTSDSSQVYASGKAKIVWVDSSGAKSVRIPDVVREGLPTA